MKLRDTFLGIMLAVPLLAATWGAAAMAQSAAPSTPPPPPALDPMANKILDKMCQALGAANAFSFHADIMFDQVLPGAVKVQYSGAMDYMVQRPGDLSIVYRSDLGAKDLWYGNGNLTLFDPKYGMYATIAVPTTLDEMLDQVAEKQGVRMPLSDLAYSNACARPLKVAIYGGYLGVNSVGGVPCDHLAYSSKTDDMQIWIDHAGKPIPRKIVINHRSEPGSPEFIALLSNWKFPADIVAARFEPQLPQGAKKIEFMKVEETKQ
jgi:hypothetical protein